MAVEKAAVDIYIGSEDCRKNLTDAVDRLEEALKAASKRSIRQRIRKTTKKLAFDGLIVKPTL